MTVNPGRKFVWDARQAARHVSGLTAGKTFDEYLANDMLRWAVERQLMIVGEALSALRRVDPASAAQIHDLARIVGFRNVLVHGYTTVDDSLVWRVVERDLPGLTAALEALLPTDEPDGTSP